MQAILAATGAGLEAAAGGGGVWWAWLLRLMGGTPFCTLKATRMGTCIAQQLHFASKSGYGVHALAYITWFQNCIYIVLIQSYTICDQA
jgi:hypothetical protein